MGSRNRNDGIIKNQAKRPESVNICYAVLPNRPESEGRRRYSALRRADITRTFIARFHTKYQKSDGCWLWQAGKYRAGYGIVNLGRNARGEQHTDYAHRVAYVLAKGEIPQGKVVMHACDVRACVNPDHLSLGTQGDNVCDAARKGRYDGERASKQKLTLSQVQAIYASTEKAVRLAIRYRVSKALISRIRRHGYRVVRKVAA